MCAFLKYFVVFKSKTNYRDNKIRIGIQAKKPNKTSNHFSESAGTSREMH